MQQNLHIFLYQKNFARESDSFCSKFSLHYLGMIAFFSKISFKCFDFFIKLKHLHYIILNNQSFCVTSFNRTHITFSTLYNFTRKWKSVFFNCIDNCIYHLSISHVRFHKTIFLIRKIKSLLNNIWNICV